MTFALLETQDCFFHLFYILILLVFILCVRFCFVFGLHIYLCTKGVFDAYGDEKGALDSLEVEL